jgi:2,4-dienoyl-CoA reductase (NADPH2)
MATLYDSIKIGGIEIPNRMAAAPTVMCNGTEDGYVTDRAIRSFTEEAQGGWGLLQVSASFIHPEGNIFRTMIGIYNDKSITGHERLSRAIHRQGTKCSCQLIHGGALSNTAITGLPVVGASVKGGVFGSVRELSTDEAEERIQYYIDAAARVKEAGYDAVNVHSCQGTLIQQFMSPFTNLRKDKFGQDPGLFPEMIVKGIKERCGKDFPLIYRLAAHEFMDFLGEPGYNEEWGKKMAKRLEPWVDCFDVTGGRIGFTGMYAFPPVYGKRATRVHLATDIKGVVSVPVMGVAKIMEPKLAEHLISSGQCDIAHFCRPAIADPWFARKAIEGRPEDIRKCISCNWCLQTLFEQKTVLCAVNASYNREAEYEIKPAVKVKKVMVVGGGVAGLEATVNLAERGHKVDLYEKSETWGGLVESVASRHPRVHTADLRNILDFYTAQLGKMSGIKAHLKTEVTPEFVQKANPDAVVVAVGSQEALPDIPGIGLKNVITNEDYLRAQGKVEMGENVVVIGGNYGAETAVSLARQGKKVTMVEESGTAARPAYSQDLYSRLFQLDRFIQEEKITVLLNTRAVEITAAGVVVEAADGKKTLPADAVIIAYNRKPCKGLYEALKGKVKELYEIGDCVKPRDIASAVDDGTYVGVKI